MGQSSENPTRTTTTAAIEPVRATTADGAVGVATPSGQQKHKLFLGTFIHSEGSDRLKYRHGAAVCVSREGKIVHVEEAGFAPTGFDGSAAGRRRAEEALLPRLGWRAEEVEVVAATGEGQFFFPGFVDTHLHASQYPNVGIFGKTTLLDWLNVYTFPMEASLSDADKARRVYGRCVRKTLAHGTTCAAYYATVDVASTNLLADLCLAAGQRALVGRVCMDSSLSPAWYRDESAAAGLEATRESIAHISRVDPGFGTIRPCITPRFAPSCSAELMGLLGELHRETGLPVQTHISENKGEIELVKELFCKKDEDVRAAGGHGDEMENEEEEEEDLSSTYAGVYDRFGLLTDKTILAHAIHLSEGEADLIASRGAKVSHCPCSNSAITSGAARVRWLLSKGIDVGLGTDMSGGYSPSVLEAARLALLVSRHVAMGGDAAAKLSVEEVLYLATRGGAEVVGLGARVGAFEVGFDWDAQLVGLGHVAADGTLEEDGVWCGGGGASAAAADGEVPAAAAVDDHASNVDIFGWETWEDRVAKWLFNGDDRNTKKVWVRGRLVHERK